MHHEHDRARIFRDGLDKNDTTLPADKWHDPSTNNTKVYSRRYNSTKQQSPQPKPASPRRFALVAVTIFAIFLAGSMASFAYFASRASHLTTTAQPSRPTPKPSLLYSSASRASHLKTTTQLSLPTLTPSLPTPTPSLPTSTPSLLYSSMMGSPDSGGWAVAGSATEGCAYNGGGYQVGVSSSNTYIPCMAQNLTGSSFVFQARMTITSASNDGGGLIFLQRYRFHVVNGAYDLAGPAHAVSGVNPDIKINKGQSILLTVAAGNSSISLYVNKTFLIHINDSTASSGGFGLFAVDFSHPTTAVFTDVSILQETSRPTPTPSQLYSSMMFSPDSGGWAVAGSATEGCAYNGGGYQVGVSSSNTYIPCMAQNLTGNSFVFQARMTITSASNDGGGLIFRRIYRFHVINGAYDLAGPAHAVSGVNPDIKINKGQSILLTVVAKGSDISLYVNKTFLIHINDSTASSGGFGLFAVDFSHPTTAVFTDVSIRKM